ncbi:MAG: VOC family protein [Acidimicrobiaceae bacterium]|nr:VOC family protein [Acidimicrobiaceae bacterium]
MAITRLNHAVLYVRDVERSVAFYRDILGFKLIERMSGLKGAAFLRAPSSNNDHDLGLFEIGDARNSGAGAGEVGLYHLAWEVETLADLSTLAELLSAAGALVGASDHGTTKSLYAKDPDGIEFEVAWIIPLSMLDDSAVAASKRVFPLNLSREIARYGADTLGGVGISTKTSAS